MKKNIYGIELKKLEEEMLALGQKKFRATQLFTWLYEKKATSFDEMSDISLKFREVLNELYYIELPKVVVRQDAMDGTIKLLVEVDNGAKVECVLMRYEYGNAICVTSQVGCNMGCAFCASGLLKKNRNLETHEIVGQVLLMNKLLEEENEKVTHIVVMGTGEPFDNYENVLDFVRIMNHPKGLEIGARHITVSTCGIVPKIKEYAHEGLQVNLAISLHAPNNELRNKIMKINHAYPLEELMEAIKYYESVTSRRVTFEYIMLKELNDNIKEAKELAHLVRGINAYVNLIPYNEVSEMPFRRSNRERVRAFMDYLKQNGVNVTVRKEFGTDIDAACGQLRAKKEGIIK
jgi:23S rRNA (adenine2503-C2)-methyltransferase